MRFKKVYIEITNSCNLKCEFCIGNSRKLRFMKFDDFKFVLAKISPYTKYLYFHILGEPLLHPNIVDFINYACEKGFYVNITTNGYLIDRLKNVSGIRQLNISIHSFDIKYGISLEMYMNNIFSVIDSIPNTYVSFRFWTQCKMDLLNPILNHYSINKPEILNRGFQAADRRYVSFFHEFIWPDLNNNFYDSNGKCYGLINQLGILCDGSIVPCCLDSNASICLGNIYSDDLDEILNSERVNSMIDGFKRGYKCEEFCKHCNFLEK